MPGARSVLPKPRPFKPLKRKGKATEAEKALVAQFVLDQPAAITPSQTTALARTLRRSKEATIALIEQAKENFQSDAERYVVIHKEAVEKALANGDSKSLQVAVQGSEWALENLQAEGVSIVGKKQEVGSQAGKIMIGINIGGIRKSEETVDAVAVEVPPQ
jgi:hypothetical protein